MPKVSAEVWLPAEDDDLYRAVAIEWAVNTDSTTYDVSGPFFTTSGRTYKLLLYPEVEDGALEQLRLHLLLLPTGHLVHIASPARPQYL